ncbi:hypothetical protein [Hyalangium rubrum]|uniref:Uncharacterized protein n=1 Tax=Hyalangium rubrum TaxID=3103134 RepID=A0ABU5HC00_9BACT|nr:hypothetical protein [Hyalangium sp. s54d21]MDY7230987.1 hypothetical protein [Hyalangium sp. s54d21]
MGARKIAYRPGAVKGREEEYPPTNTSQGDGGHTAASVGDGTARQRWCTNDLTRLPLR